MAGMIACLLAPVLGVEYRIVPFGAAPRDALQPWLDDHDLSVSGVRGTLDDMFNEFHQDALENGLPNFETEDHLRADKVWSNYFTQVYGEVPSGASNYPIKVVDLGIIYLRHLPKMHLEKTLPAWQRKESLFTGRSQCPDIPGQLWGKQEQLEVPDAYLVHHPPSLKSDEPGAREAFAKAKVQGWKALGTSFWKRWGRFKAHANYTRVEVTHCVSQLSKRAEQNSSWMYAVRGSGVFFDVGQTMVFDGHRDAVDHFLPNNNCKGECWNAFADLMKAASVAGVDSLQFVTHGDQRCGLGQMEIVDVRGVGAQSCSSQFSSGWRGTKPCQCVTNQKCANCRPMGNSPIPLATRLVDATAVSSRSREVVTTYPNTANAATRIAAAANASSDVTLVDMRRAFSRRLRQDREEADEEDEDREDKGKARRRHAKNRKVQRTRRRRRMKHKKAA